jgi:hypothetical protein
VSIKRPINEDQVEIQVWYAGTDREIRGRALCDVGGPSKVGVGLLELPPGCNTQPGHYHTKEEEHLYGLGNGCDLAFSPDARQLALSDDDTGIRVFALDLADLADIAESRLVRSLTAEECGDYLDTEPCPS